MTMNNIRFELKVEPTAKARAKTTFNRYNGRVWSYTPKKSKDAEDSIKLAILPYTTDKFPVDTPLKMTCEFYRTKPQSLSKKVTMPYKKPDVDNYYKSLDVISKAVTKHGAIDDNYLIPDDGQITTLTILKRWTTREYGYIVITIETDTLSIPVVVSDTPTETIA
jgi:Holliday junction resolvase RusA-like endonuclease